MKPWVRPYKGRWRLDSGGTTGRVRLNFETKEEALRAEVKLRRELQKYGHDGNWSHAQRADISQALGRLKETNLAGTVSLDDCVAFYVSHMRPDAGVITLREIMELMVEDRKLRKKDALYIKSLREHLEPFVRHHEGPEDAERIHLFESPIESVWIC
jgi:hypothetical protein